MLQKYTRVFGLILAIIMLIVIEYCASITIKSYIYSWSLLIKDIILFILPIAIFFCILSSILKLGRNALPLMLGLFICILLSNILLHTLAFFPAVLSTNFINTNEIIEVSGFQNIKKIFPFEIKNPLTPIKALAVSTIFAIYISIFNKNKIILISNLCNKIGFLLLKRVIAPLAPFFIFGQIVKTLHEKLIFNIIKNMPIVFLIFTISSLTYTFILYILSSKKNTKRNIINMLPAFFVGVASMSSSISIPTLIKCVNKNLGKKTEIVNIVTPYVSNFHSIAGAFILPVLAFYIYAIFNNQEHITFLQYLPIAVSLSIIKFAGIGVPSGGILVALPILQASKLSFDNNMSSLIITVYFMADFINTGINVLGNGAYIICVNNVYERITNIINDKSHKKIKVSTDH